MRVVIPAKACSTRVLNKNFRPFYKDYSLVDLAIKKLKRAGFAAKDIFVTSENARELLDVRLRHKVKTIVREPKLADNDTQLTHLIRITKEQLPTCREVAWCQVTTPTFDKHRQVMAEWQLHRQTYDSLAVAVQGPTYAMMQTQTGAQPLGWSFGNCHTKSQDISPLLVMPFTFSILTEKSIRETGYYVGRNPFWFIDTEQHLDIDTMQDYRDAQAIYAARRKHDRLDTDTRNKTQKNFT